MSDIEWADPPKQKRKMPGEYDRIVKLLQEKPGKWARVSSDVTSTSASHPWRNRGCEAVARKPRSGTPRLFDVYARWPAGKEAAAGDTIPKGSLEELEDHLAVDKAPPQPETPEEKQARRVADRLRADRERRGVPPEGRSLVRGVR